MVSHLLHRLEEGEHENASGEALQNSWIRLFGHPSLLRLDFEGAFRSRIAPLVTLSYNRVLLKLTTKLELLSDQLAP